MNNLRNLFSKKTRTPAVKYDPEKERPIIRASICTGERVAGFKDRKTGVFHDVMLIRNQPDLDEFMETYGLEDIDTEY